MVDVNAVVGIVGLGTMGRSLARLCLGKGFEVVALGRTPESGKKKFEKLTGELKSRIDKGKLTLDEFNSMMSRMKLVESAKGLSGCGIVIEAIYEDAKAKGDLYRSIEPHLEPRALISSNTSSLSIEELSANLKDPSRFLGLHFFNPAEVMKLVEVRRCKRTKDATVQTACDFVAALGKTPIMTPDSPGLYVNRILFPMLLESISVLETTNSPIEEIDEAMKLGTNLPMGPFELCDFIGNDIVLSISYVLLNHTGDLRFKPPQLLIQMVEMGKLGRKSGRGFYEYNK